jgi:hypothetical protein
MKKFLVSNFFVLLLVCFCAADEYSSKYEDNEKVLLFVNKVGPFRNPQEVYGFHILPFCQPGVDFEYAESRFEGLGEALQGYELVYSGMDMRFKGCQKNLNLTKL